MENAVTLTESAEKKLLETFTEEGKSTDTHHLRVGVASGGCSGLQYYMEIHKKEDRDETDIQFNTKILKLWWISNLSFIY